MDLSDGEMETHLNRFEGLVFATSQRLVRQGVEAEHEDISQLLRVKIWRAIRAFDPSKGKSLEKYVFMCVYDQAKDIAKKKKRGELHIEDVAPYRANDEQGPRDKFDERYLSVDHEEIYGRVEDELPVIPNTLTHRERLVLVLMYRCYKQTEIAEALSISKRDVESAVRTLREKLADWRPDSQQRSDESAAPAALTVEMLTQ